MLIEQRELIQNIIGEMQERLYRKGIDLKEVVIETSVEPRVIKRESSVVSVYGCVKIKETEIQEHKNSE